ncbi:formylglycine-generating enzyme family protein [Candidatus Electronema sp. TJ]|uniref:formylglycine-generating enzyme family protein n=1 Tax=Candidatus Electronema sp. TJ TaxID=3401573 RepID=UPI003AA90C74
MSRPQISRADLLRLLALQPEVSLPAAAPLAGYQLEAVPPFAAKPAEVPDEEAGYETAPSSCKTLFPAGQFWHLRRREPLTGRRSAAELPGRLRQFRPLRAKELRLTANSALPRRRPDPAALPAAAAQFRPPPCRPAQAETAPPPQIPPAALALQLLRAGQQPAWLEPFFLRFFRTWFERKKDADLIRFARQVLELPPPGRQQDWQGCLYGIAHRDALRQGAAIPPQFQPEAALAGAAEPLPPSPWLLIQEGETMFLLNSPERDICLLRGSRIAALELTADLLLLRREDGRAETVPVRSGQPLFSLRGAEHFSLQTASEILHVHACVRPSWAALIGRNSRELFAELPWLGRSHRLYWQAPARSGEGRWASCHGPADTDQFGLSAYIGFYGRVMQRFRWLAPGRFLMGSPPDEPERETWGKETLHEVRLSKGFWLADTAVTQELWQFVMRGNPSKFQGRELPVDSVSWEDTQLFIERLNAMVPSLNIRLPTEAEWEYACRAGSASPFAFGSQITPEQANCNGAFPYHASTKGEFRRRTVPVKSLPANAWGFYEMHGNVWEWCQDWWQEDLGCDAALNPQGPDCGEFRAARGGSWFLGGKAVRSAARGRFSPDFRNDRIGFRIARDHELPTAAAVAPAPTELPEPPPPSFFRRIFSRS